MLSICVILSLAIAIRFGNTIDKIQNDETYQKLYKWQEIKEPYLQTMALLLIAELIHMIACIVHIRGYLRRHRH